MKRAFDQAQTNEYESLMRVPCDLKKNNYLT